MKEQNLKNHSTIFIPYNIYIFGSLFFIFIGSFVNFLMDLSLLNGLFVWLILVLMLNFFIVRRFALKAQDRAIRVEENFRHFILTGEPHDSRLRLGQIIALRFAADDEFIALSKRSAEEGLKPKEIKKEIKSWKADFHRV